MRIFSSVSVHQLDFFFSAWRLINLHKWNLQEDPTAVKLEDLEQIEEPSFALAFHNTAGGNLAGCSYADLEYTWL